MPKLYQSAHGQKAHSTLDWKEMKISVMAAAGSLQSMHPRTLCLQGTLCGLLKLGLDGQWPKRMHVAA